MNSTQAEVLRILKQFTGDFRLPNDLRKRDIEKDHRSLSFRKIHDTETAHRCCYHTTEDLQSGPIYCGQLAVYKTDGVDELAFCEYHKPWKTL